MAHVELPPGAVRPPLGPRSSNTDELSDMRTTIGALDQWIVEQDLLLVPEQLGLLAPLFECDDPLNIHFYRGGLHESERGI